MNQIKIITVVGARPQFVKAAMVSRAILDFNAQSDSCHITEEILHTGQHYDPIMSQVFFEEMSIPEPVLNLSVGSGLHGETTGRMLSGIEAEIIGRKPDWVLIYGDTNSTLAAALAAAKLHVKLAHVEAGLRSYNRRMPEEINRVLADHVSTALFCPTQSAVENLRLEGVVDSVFMIGDVMYDAALAFGKIAEKRSRILDELKLSPRGYYLVTVHRAENTDDRERLQGILGALAELAKEHEVIFPMHPRTKKIMEDQGLARHAGGVRIVEPVAFIDMVRLEQNAMMILTDSGGIQKEAYFHGVPCVTLRDETEWVETVTAGWNQVVGTDASRIIYGAHHASCGTPIADYGTGNASAKIVDLLAKI